MTKQTQLRNQLTFGIELEYERIDRDDALAAVVAAAQLHGVYARSLYGKVVLTDGRIWAVKRDGSLNSGCETVSPICTTADIPMVQSVVRELRRRGAVAGPSAGLHIHVGMQNWSDKQVANLIKVCNKQEAILRAMIGTSDRRAAMWCAPIPAAVLAVAESPEGRSNFRWDLRTAAGQDRYQGVNVVSLRDHGTIEFRFFEATTHAGVIRSNIELILHMAAYAYLAKRTSGKRRVIAANNTKYCARAFLKQIGMVGDAFANCRMHLCAPLKGDSVLNRTQHHGYESWTEGRGAA